MDTSVVGRRYGRPSLLRYGLWAAVAVLVWVAVVGFLRWAGTLDDNLPFEPVAVPMAPPAQTAAALPQAVVASRVDPLWIPRGLPSNKMHGAEGIYSIGRTWVPYRTWAGRQLMDTVYYPDTGRNGSFSTTRGM